MKSLDELIDREIERLIFEYKLGDQDLGDVQIVALGNRLEVECLDCHHVWTELTEGEPCPNCGADPQQTVYIQE